MNYKNIPAYEADFRAKGVDSDGKRFRLTPVTVRVPGTSETFIIVSAELESGDQSFWYPQLFEKKRIIGHFTAGYIKGDMAALSKKNNHVSVPFVLARDGTIYKLFSSAMWSYSLGKGAAGGNEPMGKSGVAFELTNVGYLREKNGMLLDPYGAVYCSMDDRDAYTTLAKPYRGYTRFATFTDAQYKSTAVLLRYLSATYSIPLRLLPEDRRYDVYRDVANWHGITTHVNYQPERYGKWDIGPAFAWDRIGAS